MFDEKAVRFINAGMFCVFLIGIGVIVGINIQDEEIEYKSDLNKAQTDNQYHLKEYFVQGNHAHTRFDNESTKCVGGHGISMAPAIFPGNTVCYVPYNNESVAIEGDIIIYEDILDGNFVGHAVISKTFINGTRHYITKGYNNIIADPDPVPEENVVGIVVEVKYT